MTLEQLQELINRITFPGKNLRVGVLGDGFFLQVTYHDNDIISDEPTIQHGRKWYVSSHSVPGEVVQTALKALLTSAEHEVREHFQFDGYRVFSPHFSLNVFIDAAKERRFSYRKDPNG